jgi:hypothetical protein
MISSDVTVEDSTSWVNDIAKNEDDTVWIQFSEKCEITIYVMQE